MVLVVFLLAYVLRQRLDRLGILSSDELWNCWLKPGTRKEASEQRSLFMAAGLVLVPTLALGLLVLAASYGGIRLILYPLEFVLLVLLMGVPGWREVLESYTEAWSRGDMQAAWHHVEPKLPESGKGQDQTAGAMHLSVARALMMAVFQRFFLVVFWYLVGGIWLAVLVRGLVAVAEQWPQAAVRARFARVAAIAAWLPARVLACTFGIAGDLAGWTRAVRAVLPAFDKSADDVLMISAGGSLTGYALDPERFTQVYADDWHKFGGRSVRAMRDLLSRCMLVWICAVAVLVIAGVL
ncbi:MAG TPA: histidine kinase [Marinobacter sp.]|nr:histidine kinase [Marinobacter sp.]